MTDADFNFIANLLKERSGLIIGPEKTYLLETRLLSIMRSHGFAGLHELITAMRMAGSEALTVQVVDAMTTNETSFFRDHGPFDKFRNIILPALLTARASQRRLRIWSAACSTGQEPYSLAMILREHSAQLAGWRIEIVATDLSERVLEKARARTYSTFEVQRGMPVQLLMKYFEQVGNDWRLKPEIGNMVDFRPCNLLGDLRGFGVFDVVFCRNVLIYFDQPTKRTVLSSISRQMHPDSFLMLGGSESMYGISDAFADVTGQRGLYRRARPGEQTPPIFANSPTREAAMPRAANQ